MRLDESSGSRRGGSTGSPAAGELFVEWYGSGVAVSGPNDQPDELWRLVSTLAEPSNGLVVMVSAAARRWPGIALVLSQARRRATEELTGTEWSPLGRPVRVVSADRPELDFPAPLCSGWGRIGPRLYRQPLDDGAAIAEVLPAGILLRPSGMYASGASAFFDPLAGTLAVGTAGVAVAEALVLILVALFASFCDPDGWTPRMRIDGIADDQLASQLDVITDRDAVPVQEAASVQAGATAFADAMFSAPDTESPFEVTESAGPAAEPAAAIQVQAADLPAQQTPARPVEIAHAEAAEAPAPRPDVPPAPAARSEATLAPPAVGPETPPPPAPTRTSVPPVVTVTAPVLEGTPAVARPHQPMSSGRVSDQQAPESAGSDDAAQFAVAGGPAASMRGAPPPQDTQRWDAQTPQGQSPEGQSPEGQPPQRQPPQRQPAAAGASPSASMAVPAGKPFPAELAIRIEDRASSAEEQRRFVAAIGDDFTRSLATVNAALAAWPALRRDDSTGAKVDFVAVCIYLGQETGGAVHLNAALRRGEAPAIEAYLPCLVSGLQRLPLQRRAVVCQGKLDAPVPERYPIGRVLAEPGFRSASVSLDATVLGANVDFLIWGRTARQVSVLTPGRALDEAIFLAGTRFKVLALHNATEGDDKTTRTDGDAGLPSWTVLLREVLTGEVTTPNVQNQLDSSALARLKRALEQRRGRPPQVVTDGDLAERLAGSLVGLGGGASAGPAGPPATTSVPG